MRKLLLALLLMPITISATVAHALSMTTPDDPAYENQPQHWNSGHPASFSCTLNAVGSEIVGAFSNSNGLSFGIEPGGGITASYTVPPGGGVVISAGTTNSSGSAFSFDNSGNVTFGITGATITGSYQPGVNQIDAGGGGLAAQVIPFGNANGVSFAIAGGSVVGSVVTTYQPAGAYLTTAALSNHSHGNPTLALTNLTGTTASASDGFTLSLSAAAAGAGGGIAAAAGTQTGTSGTVVFADSNGLTFGMSGSTQITGSYSQSTHSHSQYSFSNLNGVTFGTAGSTVTASVATNYLTTAMLSNASTQFVQANAAFAGTNASGTIASDGISVSVAAAGAGGGATLSYFENVQVDHHSGTIDPGGSTIWVGPFVLPQNISCSFIRVPVTLSHVTTTFGVVSANTTFSATRFQTDCFVIYSQGTGASSMSLQSVTSGSAGWTYQTRVGNGTANSQYTVTFNVTYPSLGANTQVYTTSYNVSSSTYNISSQSMTAFTGWRWKDYPFAGSLSPGNYWIGFGESTTSSNNGPAGLVGASIGDTLIGISLTAISVGYPGQATNSSIQFLPGLGLWTTNARISSVNAMALSNISAMVSNVRPYFQMIRRA